MAVAYLQDAASVLHLCSSDICCCCEVSSLADELEDFAETGLVIEVNLSCAQLL